MITRLRDPLLTSILFILASCLAANGALADAISNLQLVHESGNTLIVSVEYTYDSASGDCMRMRGVPDDGAVFYQYWPVRPGTHHAYLTMHNNSTLGSPSTTTIDVRMESCQGGLVMAVAFPYSKTWDISDRSFLATAVELVSETPSTIEYTILYELGTAHASDVRIFPRAVDPSGAVPFSQGVVPSEPLVAGGPRIATGSLKIGTSGIFQTEVILFDMREDGGPPFFAGIIPRAKVWDLNTADADSDGLSDDSEAVIGTNPFLEDTDDDGLNDGWELQGYVWTDGQIYPDSNLPFLGADPLHKDVFVEVDYLLTTTGDQSMHLDSMLSAKKLFADMPISNPDAQDGIELHIYNDQPIAFDGALGGVCGMRTYLGFFHDRKNRIYHWAIAGAGGGGQADVVSNHFTFGTGNGNPGMNRRSKFMSYALFAHELGHNLGLLHEGRNGSGQQNCKPSYFSMMNYAYDYGFQCGAYSLASTTIQFSDGSAPSLDLNFLSESSPPAGLANLNGFESDSPTIGCNFFGVSIPPLTIDWDQSGTIDAGTFMVNTSGIAPACADEGVAPDQRDSNDFGTIEEFLAEAIRSPGRSTCEEAGPQNGYMRFGKLLEMQPVCGVGKFSDLLGHPFLRSNPVFEPVPGTQIEHPQLIHELAPLLDQNLKLGDPLLVDEDQDQVPDWMDNCLGIFNPGQEDENNDQIGTHCQCADTDFDGIHTQADIDAMQVCANDPQTCQLDPGLSDTNDDGAIDQDDVDALVATILDPPNHPVEDLVCANRPDGISPVRYVPEPGGIALWLAGLGFLHGLHGVKRSRDPRRPRGKGPHRLLPRWGAAARLPR